MLYETFFSLSLLMRMRTCSACLNSMDWGVFSFISLLSHLVDLDGMEDEVWDIQDDGLRYFTPR